MSFNKNAMNKRLSEILEFISPEKLKKDRRIIVFAICLLIATILWFLNALSKKYTTTLSYPVKYVNPPENKFLANTPASTFDLKIEAYGFTLLRHKLAFSFSPILIDMTYISQNNSDNGKSYNFRTEEMIRHISDQVSNEIKIIDISPKIITLIFDFLITKDIEVLPDINIDFENQFYLSDSITINPGKIKITGPSLILDTLKYLKTEAKNYYDVNSSIKESVNILSPKKTTLSRDKVEINIPAEKFTEKKIKIPLNVKPEKYKDNIKLFPSEVTVSFMVGLSSYEKITPGDFKAFVDYAPVNSDQQTLKVLIELTPQNIQNLRVTPEEVEFLIETN